MTTQQHNIMLDLKDFDSPIPTIETKNTLDSMATGEILKLLTSKESTVKNIRMLVANNSYELLHEFKSETEFTFLIKKL